MRVLFYVSIIVILASTIQAHLVSVYVIFRHGARAPVLNVTSKEAKSYFYRGLGQLTDEGVEQAKLMGKILKDRYVNSFVDERMVPSQLYFRSSPVERCLTTVQTVGQTMFPNATPAVQTVAKPDDFLLVPKMDCDFSMPEYRHYFNLSEEDVKAAKFNPWAISDKAMQKAIAQTTSLKERQFENLPALILEREAGLAVPSWFNEEAYKESIKVFYHALSVMASVGDYFSPRGIRVKTGLLLDTIFKDIESKVRCHMKNEKNCDKRKFQVFSSHDLLILPLLEALGIREKVLGVDMPPEFLSTVVIETMLIEKQPYVRVFFRKNPRDTALQDVTSKIRNCPEKDLVCPAELFTSCCEEFRTSDPKQECYENSAVQWEMTPMAWLFAGIGIILLTLLIFTSYFVIRYKNRSVLNMKKVCLEN